VKARARSIAEGRPRVNEGLLQAARSKVKNNLLNIMTQTEQKTVLDAIEQLHSMVEKLERKVKGFNKKFDNYHKVNQRLVNLAFGMIASATIVTLAQTIFRR
jgi:hypothetical protein